jgi:hypothetical protein
MSRKKKIYIQVEMRTKFHFFLFFVFVFASFEVSTPRHQRYTNVGVSDNSLLQVGHLRGSIAYTFSAHLMHVLACMQGMKTERFSSLGGGEHPIFGTGRMWLG